MTHAYRMAAADRHLLPRTRPPAGKDVVIVQAGNPATGEWVDFGFGTLAEVERLVERRMPGIWRGVDYFSREDVLVPPREADPLPTPLRSARGHR